MLDRGYPETLIQTSLSEVNFEDRKLALQPKEKKNKRILPFVTQYQPAVPNLKQILMKHLIEQPLLREIYKDPPLISYKEGDRSTIYSYCSYACQTMKEAKTRARELRRPINHNLDFCCKAIEF